MPYGHEMLEAELPGEVVELRSAYPEPSDDEATLVAQALDEPLGTPPVEELARGKRSAVILIACRTRRTGSHIYVPMIVERLLRAGMPRHAISVVTATGSHDNFRPEDAALLLGPRLEERIAPRNRPFAEVREEIRQTLRREKARALQARITEETKERYPAQINEALWETSGSLPRNAWVYAVAGTTHSVEQVLADIYATWAYNHIRDERERIRAALPALIETQQVLMAARESRLLENPVLATKLRLIRNRLAGERYWRTLMPKEKPSEKQLREHHAQNPDIFRTPPQAKGLLFRWKLESAQSTTEPVRFLRESLRSKVAEVRDKAAKGQLSQEQLRKLADAVEELDWFREGPHGYLFDKAFFGAKEKSYTEVFDQREGIAFGWVEARKESTPILFEECRDWVERRYLNLRADDMRRKLLEEILAQYARQCHR
jgi:hypothetical protein